MGYIYEIWDMGYGIWEIGDMGSMGAMGEKISLHWRKKDHPLCDLPHAIHNRIAISLWHLPHSTKMRWVIHTAKRGRGG